jgi:hypothetical protein
MALFLADEGRLHLKIVYYGPGMGGKTTNLLHLYRRLPPQRRGRWVSLKTGEDRTIFFDFLPLELGDGTGLRARIHLYTVPGQVRFRRTRRLLLQEADGIVFVADSDPSRLQANAWSLADLRENLASWGRSLEGLPMVLQLNKRDLPGALAPEILRRVLNLGEVPAFEAVATRGDGVVETAKAAVKMVLHRAVAG